MVEAKVVVEALGELLGRIVSNSINRRCNTYSLVLRLEVVGHLTAGQAVTSKSGLSTHQQQTARIDERLTKK